jgi:hypothetical protein
VLFEWTDEWFKNTWNTMDTDFPRDRRQLWRNVLTNEEQFGVLAVEPGRKKPAVVLDGRDGEWTRNGSKRVVHTARGPVREIRSLGDAAYLHLLVRTDGRRRSLTLGFDVRPGSNRGLPGTSGAYPGADVAVTLGPGRRATIQQAAWTDPLLHQYGLGLGMLPVDADDLRRGSGVWTRPTLMLNRPYTVPSTGEQRPVELKDLGAMPWGTGDPRARGFDVRTLAAGGGSLVELRIPWALLGFADPSDRSVFVPRANGTFDSRKVKRIGIAAAAPGEHLVRGQPVALKGWNTVAWHERRKASWPALRSAFAELSQR